MFTTARHLSLSSARSVQSTPLSEYEAVCPVIITVSLLSDTVRLFVQSALQCPCSPIMYRCLSSQHYSVHALRYCTAVCPVSTTVPMLSDTLRLFVQSALQCLCSPILYRCLILMLCVCNCNTVERSTAYWR